MRTEKYRDRFFFSQFFEHVKKLKTFQPAQNVRFITDTTFVCMYNTDCRTKQKRNLVRTDVHRFVERVRRVDRFPLPWFRGMSPRSLVTLATEGQNDGRDMPEWRSWYSQFPLTNSNTKKTHTHFLSFEIFY